jgi:hypothetical protein
MRKELKLLMEAKSTAEELLKHLDEMISIYQNEKTIYTGHKQTVDRLTRNIIKSVEESWKENRW